MATERGIKSGVRKFFKDSTLAGKIVPLPLAKMPARCA
jgi:hypothetical protein